MIYLAGPYTHFDPSVMEDRYQEHMRHLAHLLNEGLVVFSPIVSWHVVADVHHLPIDWTFWRYLDLAILERCDRLIVLMLDGWQDSVGTTAEIDFAKLKPIPIEYHNARI